MDCSGRRRELISGTMTMKYRGFWRRNVYSVTRDIISAVFDVQPMSLVMLLSDHVSVDAHDDAAANVAAPAVDTRLAVERPCHVCQAGREIGFRQPFHHRAFPPVLDAVHLEQVRPIVPRT